MFKFIKRWFNNCAYRNMIDVIEDEYGCTLTVFEDIIKAGRGSYEYIPGFGDRRLWSRPAFDIHLSEGPELKGGGGCIVFPTDVDAVDITRNETVKMHSSMGNFFKGRYVGNSNEIYGEESTCIDIFGMLSEPLVKLAIEIARESKQKTALLKDFNTGRNILIDRRQT